MDTQDEVTAPHTDSHSDGAGDRVTAGNISAQDREFIARVQREHDMDPSSHVSRHSTVRRTIPWYKSIATWLAMVCMAIPLIVFALVVIATYRTESYLGSGTIDWITHNMDDPGFKEMASRVGMGWLPLFLNIYDIRWEIVGGVFILCASIAAVLLWVAQRHRTRVEKLYRDSVKDGDIDDEIVDDGSVETGDADGGVDAHTLARESHGPSHVVESNGIFSVSSDMRPVDDVEDAT